VLHVRSFRTELGATFFGRLLRWAPRVVRTVHNVDEFYVSPRYAALAKVSARGLDRIVAISDAVGGFLREEAGLPSDKIVRIYYGIDPSPYRPDAPSPVEPADAEARPTIGASARLAPPTRPRVTPAAL